MNIHEASGQWAGPGRPDGQVGGVSVAVGVAKMSDISSCLKQSLLAIPLPQSLSLIPLPHTVTQGHPPASENHSK